MLVRVFKWRSLVAGMDIAADNVVDLKNGEKIFEHLFAS